MFVNLWLAQKFDLYINFLTFSNQKVFQLINPFMIHLKLMKIYFAFLEFLSFCFHWQTGEGCNKKTFQSKNCWTTNQLNLICCHSIIFPLQLFSPGFMSSLTGGKRRKRSFYLGTPWELPLFDKPTTEKFLALLEATLEVRKVNSVTCKRQHLCKVYQWALKSEDKPLTLSTFERALVNIFG